MTTWSVEDGEWTRHAEDWSAVHAGLRDKGWDVDEAERVYVSPSGDVYREPDEAAEVAGL